MRPSFKARRIQKVCLHPQIHFSLSQDIPQPLQKTASLLFSPNPEHKVTTDNSQDPMTDEATLRLSASSLVGQSIFGGSINSILADKVEMKTNERLKQLFGEKDRLTLETVQDMRSNIWALIQQMPGTEALETRRKIRHHYRSVMLNDIEVTSLVEEVDVRLWSWIKSCAVATGQLDALQAERLLALTDEMQTKRKIDNDVLAKAMALDPEPWKCPQA